MGSQKPEAAGWCRSPCRRQIPWSNIVWIHFQRARINPPQCGVIGKWETIVMLNFDWRPSPGWALIGFNRRWNWIATTHTHTRLGPSARSKQAHTRRRTEQLYHRPGRARKVSKWCFLAAWVKVNVTPPMMFLRKIIISGYVAADGRCWQTSRYNAAWMRGLGGSPVPLWSMQRHYPPIEWSV